MSQKLHLTLACWGYDRIEALASRAVQPDGIELTVLNQQVEETFFRMMRHAEYDVAEMSLSSYTVSLSRPDPKFIAIPVFPSRLFRHSSIYVSQRSGIREPKDLIGKKVGVPEYQLTAPVWVRGILSDEYGVTAQNVEHLTGGIETPGRVEKLALNLPPGISVSNIGGQRTLNGMLLDGGIDAMFTPRAPSCLQTHPQEIRRLFENYAEVERDYYRRTRIFPIMHTVVIRRELYRKHPWVAQNLFKAFQEAQRRTYADLNETAALKVMLPWLTAHVEDAKRELGDDWWSYGLAKNRHVLDTFLRYHHEQGLSPTRLAPQDLFAPETLESVLV
jgi:4,5-dihydroxyphthalate decarboxylase